MSIQHTNIVDVVSLNDTKLVILTVSDHLDWSDENDHLYLLQEKINTYCHYIESGQLYDEHPTARDRRPNIRVVCFFQPTLRAVKFFDRVKSALATEGYIFDFKMYQQEGNQ